MKDEDCIFTHLLFDRLYNALENRELDPALLHLIFEQRNHPEMQRLLDDVCKSVAMTIEQHQNNHHTFEKLEKALRKVAEELK